jgi:hypothetical protein
MTPSPEKLQQIKEKNQKRQEAYEKEREIIQSLPSKIKFRIALTGFCIAIAIAFALFMLSFLTDFFSDQIIIPQKYLNQPVTLIRSAQEVPFYPQYLYDGRRYPNVPEQLPIFQLIGTLANTTSLVDRITSIRLGNINLKSFPNRELTNIELVNPSNPDETFALNFRYGNLSLHALQLDGEKRNPDDQRSFIRNSERKLKDRGISLEHYDRAQVRTGGIIFYPFLLEGKYPVWDAKELTPRGMWIRYDQTNHTLSIVNFEIGQYAFSHTPTLTRTQILRNFRLGEILLSSPEIVYLIQVTGSSIQTIQFIPALKFSVAGQAAPFFQPLIN